MLPKDGDVTPGAAMRHEGGMLMALGAALGLLVAVYNFFSPVGLLAPASDVAGTPGAGVAIFGTVALLLAGLVLAGSVANRALIGILIVGSFLGILGTALAGWLLDSILLVGLMVICGIGWLLRVFTDHDFIA